MHAWHTPQTDISRTDLVVIGRRPGSPGPGSVRNALLTHAHGPLAVVPA